MAYHLYSENGFVCDVASISGYESLTKFVDQFPGKVMIKELLTKGKSTHPSGIKSDLNSLLDYATDTRIKSTIESLLEGLKKVKEIAIISE